MNRPPELVWRLATWESLGADELYAALQLRAEVFVVEQQCAFQDLDGSDPLALHLIGRGRAPEVGSGDGAPADATQHGGELLAYARCFPAGVKYPEASIGRIVTRSSVRATGLGHLLVARAIAAVAQTWGVQPIRIGAQARLKVFYEQHGFLDAGCPYMEDGIAHLEMRLPSPTRYIGDGR
ncbi:MAG: GNAT family N-acetyltransferase [Burkholderiaceae bacterium]